MCRSVLSVFFVCVLCSPALAQFSIDSPTPGSVQSGAVAPPNGWKCPRNGEITARIDGGPPISFVEDLSRGDTAVVCGNSGKNGFFTVPWNWNVSGDGPHTIEFFDADVLFATVDFAVATFGTEFLLDANGQCSISDFPDPGAGVEISWDPAIQNFRITQVNEGPDVGDCIVQSKTITFEVSGQQVDVTIHNPCTGNTLEVTIRPAQSNTDVVFLCDSGLAFIQGGMQFSRNFTWQFAGTTDFICEFFLPGITANTEVSLLPESNLDFREPFQIFYGGLLIAEFP